MIQALKTAATKPNAKWSGASGTVLFKTTEANYEAAIADCTKSDVPLLKRVGTGGALTAAGIEKVGGSLSDADARAVYDRWSAEEGREELVGIVAKSIAARLPAAARIDFIQDAIRRTPLAAPELNPLLEDAVAAEKAEHEARIAAAAKRRASEEATKKALERTKELLEQRAQNRRDALKREWEAEGGRASELPELKPATAPPAQLKPETPGTAPKLGTDEETDFRRYECDRLAAAWRDAWDAGKDEGRDYLESAMWNIRGFRMVGEVGATVEFDGSRHESDAPVLSGPVKVVRPGWLLKEADGDYVALKAAVAKA